MTDGHAYHLKAVNNDSTLSSVYGVKYAGLFAELTFFLLVSCFGGFISRDHCSVLIYTRFLFCIV